MMLRGQFAQLLAPGLHDLFVQWTDLAQRDSEYDKIFNVETSKSAYEDIVEFAGFPPMVEKPEGQAIDYTEAVQGPTQRFQHRTFGQGIRTSFELIEDDEYGLINKTPQALARSAQYRKEMDCANIFNLGFTTTLSNDGVSLFNTAHPLLGGPDATLIAPGISDIVTSAGTYPNRFDIDISQSAMVQAMRQSEGLIDAMGYPVVAHFKNLLIPPALIPVSIETLGSAHKPGTANNEINWVLRQEYGYMVSHYLTSSTAWFLLPDKEYHQLYFFDRRALDEDYSDDFDTLSLKHIAFMRYAVGPNSWVGVWGSLGV